MKTNMKLIGLAAASAMILPMTAGAALVNTSFENGTTGWTLFGNVARENWADGDNHYADTNADNPADYGMALQGWIEGGSGGFFQDDPSPPIIGNTYTFSANMHFEPGFDPTTFKIKLEWIGAGMTTSTNLLGFTPGSNPSDPNEWTQVSVSGVAPAGTTSVRATVYFDGTTDVAGTLQAARVDNVSLTNVPEPSSVALLALGTIGFFIRRR